MALDGRRITRRPATAFGQTPDEGNGAAIPTIRLETDPHDRVELDGLYRTQITFPDTGKTSQHAELILSLEVTKILDLDVTFMWDRLEDPEPDGDGERPEQDDYKLTVGISLDF